MQKFTVNIKPLSVNEAWQGRRFKTEKYKKYERNLLFILPDFIEVPKRISIKFIFGFSNVASDIDNPTKNLIDIMQKKYGFNDSSIYRLTLEKQIVKKGQEFFSCEIDEI